MSRVITTVISSSAEETPRTVLRWEPEPVRQSQVTWSEDTIDNEHMDKRSSKSVYFLASNYTCPIDECLLFTLALVSAECCIFHKKREFGESSTESESSDYEIEKYMERRNAMIQEGIVDEEGKPIPIAPRRRKKRTSNRTTLHGEREESVVLNPENCDHCAYLVYLKDRAAARVRERELGSE